MMRASVLLLLLSCSSSSSSASEASATQAIGPEGGTIVVGGATVTFPKGAVASTTQVTISEGGTAPPGFVVLSSVWRCEPSGTSFSQPVTMAMPFTDDGKGAATMFWSSGGDPTFKELEGATAKNGIMTAPVMHFSSGFVGRRQ